MESRLQGAERGAHGVGRFEHDVAALAVVAISEK